MGAQVSLQSLTSPQPTIYSRSSTMNENGSGTIPRYEVAPRTDEEWAEALKNFGSDRVYEFPLSGKPSHASRPRPLQTHVSYQELTRRSTHPGSQLNRSEVVDAPLIHRDGPNAINSLTNEDEMDWSDEPQERVSRQFTWSLLGSSEDKSMSTDGSYWGNQSLFDSHHLANGSQDANGVAPMQEAEARCDMSQCDQASAMPLKPHNGLGAFEQRYEVVEAVGLPRPSPPEITDNGYCAEMERQRIRRLYEEEGWLRSPDPSSKTRLLRSRVVRRLGLNAEDPTGERFAVIAKYAELAMLTFNCSLGGVTVIRGSQEDVYLPNLDKQSFSMGLSGCPSGHAVINGEEQCLVVADMNQDWRFKACPTRLGPGTEQFYAAAPLRYHLQNDEFVDFGVLAILDVKQRDVFDDREQAVLMRLANMLVYQLATLQSELTATKSASMYEASVDFLRRSLLPNRGMPAAPAKPAEKTNGTSKKRERPPTRPKSKLSKQRTTRAGSAASLATSVKSMEPVRATKTGPKDSRSTKRKDMASQQLTFKDASDTLRGILDADAVCLVDMHDHQLFVRKTYAKDTNSLSKEAIITEFLQGKPWPTHVEPVVTYTAGAPESGVSVLGQSVEPGVEFRFEQSNGTQALSGLVSRYLTTRQVWWDRKDPEDELAMSVMDMMPEGTQSVLATTFMSYDGTLRSAVFAAWKKAPSKFDDSIRLALPFVWIIGTTLVSSLALLHVRQLEESQITYSNLQAHELRTPLHQILAITQLLRSSMSDMAEAPQVAEPGSQSNTITVQQIRDLMPFLDAIDTSGKTLHGIVDNILVWLDLKAKDTRLETSTQHLIMGADGAPKPIGTMLEELIQESYDEDQRNRRGSGQEANIETIFEISPLLAEQVTEDAGGALRKAIGKLLQNAYRYVEGRGVVSITVDDVQAMPPEGYEYLSSMRRVAITISDNGRGMSLEFVRDKLGEPWTKEDFYATGSGLSVHLAYRIIDIMGGQMEISSAPGAGCTVSIEVPLPRVIRSAPSPVLAPVARPQVGLLGFDIDPACNLQTLGESLARQYIKHGCDIVPVDQAELVIADASLEDCEQGLQLLNSVKAPHLVILVSDEPQLNAHPAVYTPSPNVLLRRLAKPVTPTLIYNTLQRPNPTVAECRPRAHFDDASLAKVAINASAQQALSGAIGHCTWRRGLSNIEDAVASLCLGDYFSARRSKAPSVSSNSSKWSEGTPTASTPDGSPRVSTPTWQQLGASSPVTTPSDELESVEPTTPSEGDERLMLPGSMSSTVVLAEPVPRTQVLVVEDNVINRKILVKILSVAVGSLDIFEAEDGVVAVEKFQSFTSPAIVLLDINMPRMDGYAAATQMRELEKRRALELYGTQGETPAIRSKIIAVSALAGDDDKRRGLVECGMDAWLTKPCPKATLQKVVEEARQEILSMKT